MDPSDEQSADTPRQFINSRYAPGRGPSIEYFSRGGHHGHTGWNDGRYPGDDRGWESRGGGHREPSAEGYYSRGKTHGRCRSTSPEYLSRRDRPAGQ